MKKLTASLSSALLLLSLSACGSEETPELLQDTSIKATLDYENNIINLPLDSYQESEEDRLNYNRIRDLSYGSCFARHGKEYQKENYIQLGTRIYGFWNPEYTKTYGSLGPGEINTEGESPGNDEEMMAVCSSDVAPLGQFLAKSHTGNELVDRISRDAYSAARNNPAWQEAREAWWACLKDKGLTPRTGDSEWGSKESTTEISEGLKADSEEKIRVLTIEAQCSKDTGMAQTLADLEASYQAPLIKENQDALNSIKEDLQENSRAMKEYLAQHQ